MRDMNLKPIPGAPHGAPIPDFPTGEAKQPVAEPKAETIAERIAPAQPNGVTIGGAGNARMHLFWLAQVASFVVSITDSGSNGVRDLAHLMVHEEDGVRFLRAMIKRDPASVSEGRDTLQYQITASGCHVFTLLRRGRQRPLRRFDIALTSDVDLIANQLLRERGLQ